MNRCRIESPLTVGGFLGSHVAPGFVLVPHGWAPFEESDSKKDDIFDLTAVEGGERGHGMEDSRTAASKKLHPLKTNMTLENPYFQ